MAWLREGRPPSARCRAEEAVVGLVADARLSAEGLGVAAGRRCQAADGVDALDARDAAEDARLAGRRRAEQQPRNRVGRRRIGARADLVRGAASFGSEATAVLYAPRPGQRMGDERFVASDDMLAASDCAIAHYHFHAQRVRNKEYAGPSGGDLQYAARYGRSCLVLTSVGEGVLGVDYYQPNGVVIDLGEIRAGTR